MRMLNTVTLPNLVSIGSENIRRGKKDRKLFLHFLQFLNDFFKKNLKNVFYCKNNFSNIQSAKI
jgi:hypothetical protein